MIKYLFVLIISIFLFLSGCKRVPPEQIDGLKSYKWAFEKKVTKFSPNAYATLIMEDHHRIPQAAKKQGIHGGNRLGTFIDKSGEQYGCYKVDEKIIIVVYINDIVYRYRVDDSTVKKINSIEFSSTQESRIKP